MTGRVQSLRSNTAGARPVTATRLPGELYTNWPDRQIGVIDSTQTAMDLVGVRFFSTTAAYATGDFVVQGGEIYQAKGAVTAGTFNPANWNQVVGNLDSPTFSNMTVNGTATFSGATSITATNANAFTVGQSGTTNPAFRVDTALGSAVTGLRIVSEPAGSNLYLQTLSSGTNENMMLDAKGTGVVQLGTNSTGGVNLAPGGGTTTVFGALTANPANASISLQPSGSGTVTIKPAATAGTINNMSIGGINPAAGNFTSLGATTGAVQSALGAGYVLSGWNKADAVNAGGIIGYSGSAGSIFGILGYHDSSYLYSFYGAGRLFNSGAAEFTGGVICDSTLNVSSSATVASLLASGNIQTTGGAVYTGGPVNFTSVTNFAIGYGNICCLTTGTGLFQILYGGSTYYTFAPSNFYPTYDASMNTGVSSNRWLGVYASIGTIQTSDEREKKDIRSLDEKELAVAQRLKKLVCMYRWKSEPKAQAKPGRLYAGIIAQRVVEAFKAEGLNPTDYAMWDEDELGDYEAVPDIDNVVQEAIFHPNGKTRFSVNYSQILAFIIAAM